MAFLVVIGLLVYVPDEQAVLRDIAIVVRAVSAPVLQQEVLVLGQGNFVRLPVAEDLPDRQPFDAPLHFDHLYPTEGGQRPSRKGIGAIYPAPTQRPRPMIPHLPMPAESSSGSNSATVNAV